MKLNIHYDCDGVLRNFHDKAFEIFFSIHPKLKKYLLPISQSRGWEFKDQFKPGPIAEKIDKLIYEEIFDNEENARIVFGEAKPFYSREEWKRHIDMIMSRFPEAKITISTHQYNNIAREATIYFLHKNGYVENDDFINILFTGEKDRYGAHFLLDDKPITIEKFNEPYKSIGVLYENPGSNSWYLQKKKYKVPFPIAKNLNDYYNIIVKRSVELL